MKPKIYDDKGYLGEWKTTENGEHYFIREGETLEEAWERHLTEIKSKTIPQLKQKSMHEVQFQEQANYNMPKVDENLVKFAKDAIAGKVKETTYYEVAKISKRQKADIEKITGEPLEAERSIITAKQIIEHINNNHGESGSSNHDMKDISNYGMMADILENYDYAIPCTYANGTLKYSKQYANKHNRNALQIMFVKAGDYIVVEAITDSKRYNEVRVVTMYKDRKK